DEYEDGIESNDMLLNENKILLEIFKTNKDKISYCESYKTITRIYNDLQKEKKKEKKQNQIIYKIKLSNNNGILDYKQLKNLNNILVKSIQEYKENVSNHEQFTNTTENSFQKVQAQNEK
ncbi:23122_t:CDS:2, partial [Gigaspora margarita]